MGKILQFPTHRASVPSHPPEVSPVVDDALAKSLLTGVPVIEQALFFMRQAADGKGVKLTERGFLNRDFVRCFWETQLRRVSWYRRVPSRESDCAEATRLQFLVDDSKYIRKHKGYITITEKGRAALENTSLVELYRDLFWSAMMEWNWAYEDRYPEFEFIQDTGPELVRLLMQWHRSTLTPAEFFDEAFEAVLEEEFATGQSREDYDEPFDADGAADLYSELPPDRLVEQALRCFQTRFFDRFCVPFGILCDLNGARNSLSPEGLYEKTEFFKSAFSRTIFGRSVLLM